MTNAHIRSSFRVGKTGVRLRVLLLVLTFVATLASSRAALPEKWTGVDIGGATAGSETFARGTYSISGAGRGISQPADQLRFIYTTLAAGGDFRLTARVASLSGAAGAEAGLMVRKDAEGNASMASVVYEPGKGSGTSPNQCEALARDREPGAYFPWRDNGSATPVAAPVWLQLVRHGNNFAAYKSTDGKFWISVTSDSGGPFQVAGPIQVGLLVASGGSNTATATIDQVELEKNPVLPYETSWIGNTSSSDSDEYTSGGSGAMWVSPDGTCYVGSFWDEGGEAGKSYKDGKVVHGFTLNRNGSAEGSITSDGTHLYYFGSITNRLNQLYRTNLAGELGDDFFPVMAQTPIRTKDGSNKLAGMACANGELYVSDQLTGQILVFNLGQDSYGAPSNVTNQITDHAVDTSGVQNPAPQAVYQSALQTDAMELSLPGLKPGQAYNVRLHFAELNPDDNTPGKRIMNLSAGGVAVNNYDLYASAGALYKATVVPLNGAKADADGKMQINVSHTHEAKDDWLTLGGVEILNLDGSVAEQFNCGGAAVGSWKSTIPEMPDRAFSFTRPGPIAADKNGNLWIVQEGTDFPITAKFTFTPGWAAIKLYDRNGRYLNKQITDVVNPTAVSYDAKSDQLLVAENGPAQNIRFYNVSSGTSAAPVFTHTFGEPGGVFAGKTPGLIHDPAAGGDARFFGPTGVGLDDQGNIYVLCDSGDVQTDLRAFSPDGKLLWSRFGLEMTTCGDFDPTRGRSDVWTPNKHYVMDYSGGKPGGEWKLKSYLIDPFKYSITTIDSCVIRRVQGKLLMFTCGQGNLGPISVFRFVGEQIVPCGCFSDGPGGSEAIWTDTNGDGIQQATEVVIAKQDPTCKVPVGPGTQAFDVDNATGDIYFAKCGTNAANPHVDKYHFTGFDGTGTPQWSPTYTSFPAQEPFTKRWGNKARLRYSGGPRDTMYMIGETNPTASQPDGKGDFNYGGTLACYDHWSTKPVKRFILRLPDPGTEKNFVGGAPPYSADGFIYEAMDVANGMAFCTDLWDTIRVVDGSGHLVTNLIPGPEVNGLGAWEDETMGLRAHYDPATGEYDILQENSGFRARENFYRWKPRSSDQR